ncbi:MAG: dihydrodipicolinate synthase family protein [Ktedonobacteraceae bacterium]|nr:dihydrodipicolinate synthase family protein [Ktedonobacteraceae bacterium]
MSLMIRLPRADGTRSDYLLSEPSSFLYPAHRLQSRVAYAAAHVVCDPLLTTSHTQPACIDWEATLAYRRHLWSYGLGVAEAMDTAQRGMGLDWSTAQELIHRSLAEAQTIPGALIACGAGTDQLAPSPSTSLEDVEAAYEEQCGFIEEHNGQIILMASRALAASAKSSDDYVRVYDTILRQVKRPVILHWLGDMFDPALRGYWGSQNLDTAMHVCLNVIREHVDAVDGIKISLLDEERERTMRQLLPSTVRMYTGDDFNYPALIRGDEHSYSHALLGIFDAIAPAASAALHALDEGNIEGYEAIFAPTVPLSRHIFQAPTVYYKTGVVFMAYLNGHQSHFRMVAGLENGRSLLHLTELFVLADKAGLLRDPELAVARMQQILKLSGC